MRRAINLAIITVFFTAPAFPKDMKAGENNCIISAAAKIPSINGLSVKSVEVSEDKSVGNKAQGIDMFNVTFKSEYLGRVVTFMFMCGVSKDGRIFVDPIGTE